MSEIKITTDKARQYFKDCNIDYSKITRANIDLLIEFIEYNLKEHKHFPMRLSKIVHYDEDRLGFKHCYLYVNGDYFKKRQAISFEKEDWIGFAGWACTNNVQPFIEAFMRWCDLMKNKTNV